jgi:hypothetical protein
MELKDFIKTTVQSIIDATNELIDDNKETAATINPIETNTYDGGVPHYSGMRLPVTELSFDVAITGGTSKTGKAGGSVDVYVAKLGADGQVSSKNENVSRVQFSMKVTLPATIHQTSEIKVGGSKKA